MNKILLAFLIFITSYIYGILTVSHQFFPYDRLKTIQNLYLYSSKKYEPDIDIPHVEKYINYVNNKIMNDSSFYNIYRADLSKKLIIPGIRAVEIEGKEKDDFYNTWIKPGHGISPSEYRLLKTTYYNIDHFGVLIPYQGPSQGLLIYNQGHGGNLFDHKYANRLIDLAKQKHYDLLVLSLTSLGFNSMSGVSDIPSRGGPIPLESQTPHGKFALFFDKNNPKLTGASLMTTGNYELIEAARKLGHYKKVIMTGVSGGGWSTTLLSALDPAIDESVSFAGSVPLVFRGYQKNNGDYEQEADPIYAEYDYWDFYVLSTLDSNGKPTRSHYEIYNDHDPCCFDGKTAEKLIAVYDKTIEQQNLKFGIIKNIRHEPNFNVVGKIIDGEKIDNFTLQSS